MHRLLAGVLIITSVGCSSSASRPDPAAPTDPSGRSSTTTASTTSTTLLTSTTSTTSAPMRTPPPPSVGVSAIDPSTAERMTGISWRPGCPVALEDLRILRVRFRGFDSADHEGELVVHARWAERIAMVFRQLYDTGFPIERMQLIDDYGASDDASVLANNTSAFNCRAVTGGTNWSRHAYGTAIDINPRQNPYVYPDGHVFDPAAEPYRDRLQILPGMIRSGDAVVGAFGALGWRWGGNFTDTPDPQHFDIAAP